MNLLELKNKLEKGKSLDGEVIYIKEENVIYGIGSVYKNKDDKNITLLKSKDETVKVDDFIKILEDIYTSVGDKEVFIRNDEDTREMSKEIKCVEFAQYDLIKMLFINV